MIVMRKGVTEDQINAVVKKLKGIGVTPHISVGKYKTVIGAIGDIETIANVAWETYSGVEAVVPILKPYKLVSLDFKDEPTVISVSEFMLGPSCFGIIAGPCSVESEDQIKKTAASIKKSGAKAIRGGAFKPRTSPYAFQGLGEEGLKMLKEAGESEGLPVVTEILDIRDIELVAQYADILQIGARNMQNYFLLSELGRQKKPVLLKRGFSATVEEFLMAAEYILKEGNRNVILCERGIRTFENSTRNTLDISSIPVIKKLSHLPIIVDPSHASGRRDLVLPLARAAVAAGADGVMVEVHPNPQEAFSDGQQSIDLQEFDGLVSELKVIAGMLGREI